MISHYIFVASKGALIAADEVDYRLMLYFAEQKDLILSFLYEELRLLKR